MKQIALSKKTYLLEAPLEILHEESLEWIEEIEFWKNEVAFFLKLLKQKSKQNPSDLKTPEAKGIEKHLIHVSVEKLEELKIEAQSHEQFLVKIMDNPKLDEHIYRLRHKTLSEIFKNFETEFKEMKKEIFQLVEGVL